MGSPVDRERLMSPHPQVALGGGWAVKRNATVTLDPTPYANALLAYSAQGRFGSDRGNLLHPPLLHPPLSPKKFKVAQK